MVEWSAGGVSAVFPPRGEKVSSLSVYLAAREVLAMAGVPSSKGCKACARQKKKCDQLKPSCSRCARLNVPCIGAGQQKYKFKSVSFQEESAVVKTPKEPVKTVGLVVPFPPVTTIPPEPSNVSTVIASKFVAALEVTDLRYSLSCYGNVLEHIPQRLGQSEALDASVKALVTAFPYHYTRQLPPDALSNYIDALTALRLCIGGEDNRLAPETLSAIYIIMICQGWIGRSDDYVRSHGEILAHLASSANVQNWRDTFELRLLETLFVPLILEAMVNPAVVMESWFMLVDSCIPRASCGRSEGFRVPSLEAQQLVRMPIFLYKPMQFVDDIKSTYHYLRIDQPRVRQHLSELNHDVVSSSEEMRASHMKLFHKYQVVYGVLLTVGAGLNSLLRTLYPHDHTLIDQAVTFTNELVFLAQHASQYRPLGASYIPPCLAAVHCVLMQLNIMSLLRGIADTVPCLLRTEELIQFGGLGNDGQYFTVMRLPHHPWSYLGQHVVQTLRHVHHLFLDGFRGACRGEEPVAYDEFEVTYATPQCSKNALWTL
ncbi:hypothetical protein FALBO_1242 [Fusarium albosuccineum]|uniref:Zn(2)-C6 fungal-type domain-containing protein n=1 Tax=Fusarium albosuccineum TaxID=1237068 RepID=A0A8H4LPD8_9HYPO|nr:hypothetical protein FALBO_1242 [Fusarium albosuccineum]